MLAVIVLFLFSVIFILLFYNYCVIPHSYWKKRGILQAKSSWIFGENWKTITKQESFAETICRIYNKFQDVRYFGTYLFTSPVLVIKDPDLIKSIFIKDFEHFVDHRSWVPETADPLWSNGLFALRGEKWKEMRAFLTPAFTGRKMRNMFVFMEDAAENVISYLKNENTDLTEIDLKDIFGRYACDVIATTAFGIEINSLKNRDNEFYKLSHEAGTGVTQSLAIILSFLPQSLIKFLNYKLFGEKTISFFTDLVDENIKVREEKGIIRPDMIHLMMEAKKGRHEYDEIDDENQPEGFASSKPTYLNANATPKLKVTNSLITSQAMIFTLGGFDTVATILRFTAYELAVNTEVQNKLRSEIVETAKLHQDNVPYEVLQKMKYMDMVITEALRKWGSGILLERVCNKPYTIPAVRPDEKEITIDIGTTIWIPVRGIHYDPNYYDNPERFDPERFNDENKEKLNTYAYLPFGHGPRNCIGNRFAILEPKVLFFKLLKEFEIVPVQKSSIPIKLTKTTILDGDSFIFGLRKLEND